MLLATACGQSSDKTTSGSDREITKSAGGSGNGNSAGDSGAGTHVCKSDAPAGETVDVPATTFEMGCNAMVDTECNDDEQPAHSVTLDAFGIDRTEVTQAEYSACVGAGACQAPTCDWDCAKGDLPAGCVHWADAKAYCAWVQKRLPTEAEWELSARGTDGRKFPWGNDAPSCDKVNMDGCGEAAAAVGSRPAGASPYGAMDMAGNAVEMVEDWYNAKYYASSPAKDPKGPATGQHYVGRGGGFKSEAVWQRTSSRDWYDATDAGAALGFRCAR